LSTAEQNAQALEVVLLEREREIVGPPNTNDVVDDPVAETAGLFVVGEGHRAVSWLDEWSSIDWMRLASLRPPDLRADVYCRA
jgi:hypothetical protein